MDYRTLGRSGVKVSPLCLGADNYGNPTPADEAIHIIDAALAAGVNFIDTADMYGGATPGASEEIIGAAFKQNGLRDRVILATKFHYPMGPDPNQRGNSRRHIMQACEASLRRLQTDYIDLYQAHRPDFEIPLDETLRALDDLVTQGKVRYIGSSTAPAWHIMEAIMVSELKGYVRFVSEQPPYNLLDRRIENELVPMCQSHGLALITWSPMAMGLLAGRYASATQPPGDSRAILRGGIYAERVTPASVEVGNRFAALAQEYGFHPAQLAVLWVKDQPGVTAPIIGPRTVEQLQTLLPVLEMTLPDEVRTACDELVKPGSAVVSFFNTAPWMKLRFI